MTLQELEEERLALIDEVQRIEVQLKDPNRINPETSERLTGHEYFDWKTKAENARRIKLTQLRELNLKLREMRDELHVTQYDEINKKLDRVIELLEEEVFE